MAAPRRSSGNGSAGNAPTASSSTSYGVSGAAMSTISQRSTSGQRAGSSAATSRFAAEEITTRARQSLMMYAASSAERYELMQVKYRPERSAAALHSMSRAL